MPLRGIAKAKPIGVRIREVRVARRNTVRRRHLLTLVSSRKDLMELSTVNTIMSRKRRGRKRAMRQRDQGGLAQCGLRTGQGWWPL